MPSLTGVTTTDVLRLADRVAALERQLRGKASAAPLGRATSLARNRPPKISGLQSQPVPGQIGATWTRSPIPDLAYYEVQIAGDASFSGSVVSLQRSEPSFTHKVDDPAAPHWVRVRAFSQSTGGGDYSDKLELVSGVVVASDMAPDAATSVSRNRVEIFAPPLLDSDGTQGPQAAEYGAGLASTYNGVVFVFVRFQADYEAVSVASLNPWRVEISLLRDGYATGDTDIVAANTSSAGTMTLGGGLSTPDEPGVGDFVYSVGIQVFGAPASARILLAPTLLELEMVEFMRARP